MKTTVKTICPYCGVGCGVIASVNESGAVKVKGDPEHPANQGRLCSKGSSLGETVYLEERLLYPEITDQQVSWEQAIATVAGRFSEIIDEHGPDAVAFYVSGQMLTEDYYVANKLMKGFIGSANIDTNSRLCMSSAVAGHKRAFGEDVVPGCYEDLEQADMLVLTGSNLAWCHPVLYQRILIARKKRPELYIVVIDPRGTQTANLADMHLAIRPGQDSVLFNGLLTWMAESGVQDKVFTEQCTSGLEEALEAARQTAPDIESVAQTCGLSPQLVSDFYAKFAETKRVVTVFSQGINQSSSGVDKVNAIINCHLFSGRIGRPGMGPFSVTGQPNAMGGREVGGLSNQLAAHMDIHNAQQRERVQRYWDSPTIADTEGLKAVELFDAVAEGKVKAVWVMATNPVVSMPEADVVKAALEQCELLVVSDCVRDTDTARLAHMRLPAQTWGEKDGMVTNSERCMSRMRPFLAAPGQAKPDWWIITEVARAMGFAEHFPYTTANDIFREHAGLSGFENAQERSFNISALQNLEEQDYDTFAPQQWPQPHPGNARCKRLYGDGQFNTANQKACFIPVTPRPPQSTPDKDFPYVLNTGRIRDHWHTMTRTGMSPRLSMHTIEPYVEIHPHDAARHSLADGQLASVSSPYGKVHVRVQISSTQQPGSLFIPMHWNDLFSAKARVDTLIKAATDPVSGQPELKHSVATIEACDFNWQGFILTRRSRLNLQYARYWTRSRGKGLWRYEIAGNERPQDWAQQAHALLDNAADNSNWVEYFDKAQHLYRGARFVDEQLESCVFISATGRLPERDWLVGLFRQPQLSAQERKSLLSGQSPTEQKDAGKTVCSCFNIGINTISRAIEEHQLTTPEQIGKHLQAGTNCGSCIPELHELLQSARA